MSSTLANIDLQTEMSYTANHLSNLLQRFDSIIPVSTNGFLNSFLDHDRFKNDMGVRVVHDDDKETHLNIDLPGVEKSHVNLTYEGKKLRWKVHRHDEIQLEDGTKKQTTCDLSGMYTLSFVPNNVVATLDNGIMSLVVIKPENLVGQAVTVLLE